MTNKSTRGSQNIVIRREVQDENRVSHRDPEETLSSIMDGLAETVLEASDEELLEDLYEEGRSPSEEAEAVRKVLLDAVQNCDGALKVAIPETFSAAPTIDILSSKVPQTTKP